MIDFDRFERRLAVALHADADLGVAPFDPASIARAAIQVDRDRSIRRGRRLVGNRRGVRRTWLLVAATLLIGTGVVGAAVVGSGLVAPNPAPTMPSAVSNPTGAPSQAPLEPSAGVQPQGALFVFNKGAGTSAECGQEVGGCMPRLWVANLYGTGAHELVPDQSGCQRFQAWSPDGTRLLLSRSECTFGGGEDSVRRGVEHFYLTDASGSEPQLVDSGCIDPCVSEDDAVFSSDGRTILFVRTRSIPPAPFATDPVTGKPMDATQVTVLASMDLETGRVVELGTFQGSELRWSPDRTQIVYTWAASIVGPQPPADPAVFVGDADGQNVHQVSPAGQVPAWSPDGTRIVFQGDQYSWTGTWTPGDVVTSTSDIYTIRPDGTDLLRLTSDETSSNPAWSPDGRIWFEASGQFWVMDPDGANAAQLSGRPPYQAWQVQPTP